MEFSFKVEADHVGKRLDLFLTMMQNTLSRSAIKQVLNAGEVTLNGVIEYRPNYKVKLGDEFVINHEAEVQPEKIEPENIPLDIIYEDNDLLVINKAEGMVVHPATGNWKGTLMNAVLFHYQKLKDVGSNLRSGLIHRLDKDTSGIILIGKTNKGLWHFSKLFAERKAHKTYLAVVSGDFSELTRGKEIVVENFIGRNPTDRKKMALVSPEKGRKAVTKFKFVRTLTYENHTYSLVEAKPVTGRTHQIRIQISKLGYPILGDVIYGRAGRFKRLMLHAWKIQVYDFSNKELIFRAEPPATFFDLNA